MSRHWQSCNIFRSFSAAHQAAGEAGPHDGVPVSVRCVGGEDLHAFLQPETGSEFRPRRLPQAMFKVFYPWNAIRFALDLSVG
ncbi:MAG: hypothetical protein OXI87_03750 [Albidovulum sp.]|nr:hypothetical protein [Albidovulum sp.]MDE0303989.1 hypothetical protein [Albidovulum sp.]MDE0532496.1 hypothetical protein [Albidovulum sp.]